MLLLFAGTAAFAQKGKVYNSGKKVVRVPLAYVHDAISVNTSDFLVVCYQVRGLYKGISAAYGEKDMILKNNSRLNIYKFDDQLNLIQKKSIERNIYGKRVWFEKLLKFGDNFWLFFSYSNIQTGKNYLFAQKFDPHNLELENEPIKVAEMLYKKKRYNYGYYNFSFSPDGNFLMIAGIPTSVKPGWFRIKSNSDKDESTVTAWVLSQEMQIVNYAKKIKLSSQTKKLFLIDYIVGNDASITFLGGEAKEEKSKKKRFKKKADDKIKTIKFVVAHMDSLGEMSEYNFSSKDVNLIDVKMAFNPVTGNLSVLGLYSELLKGAKGVLNIQLESDDLSEVTFEKAQFSDAFIKDCNAKSTTKSVKRKRKETTEKDKPKSKYLSKKDKESESSDKKTDGKNKSDDEIGVLNTVVALNFDSEGNPIAIFEKQWLVIVVSKTKNSNGSTTTTTTYYYNYGDAVICKIKDGEIASSQTLKKWAELINIKREHGFDCLEDDDNVLILYGDKTVEYNKEDLKPDKKSGSTKKEAFYKINGMSKKLADNKILITRAKNKRKLELQYYRY